MTELCVFWQNSETRRWYPVGILSRTREGFQFVYTKGAQEDKAFTPFGRMTNLEGRYESTDLFPLFANRILSTKRPEYSKFVQWIAAEQQAGDPMVLLGRTGGRRATDTLVVYPKPEPNESGEFDLIFLCHGISHLPKDAIDRVANLKMDEALFPMFDVRNPQDRNAIALRTDDPTHLIGYVPRFFAKDFRKCIDAAAAASADVELKVVRVNPDAPHQFRLLCRLTGPWPADFSPWGQPEYQPIAKERASRGAVDATAAE